MRTPSFAATCLTLQLALLTSCDSTGEPQTAQLRRERAYMSELNLGRPLEFRPRRLSTGGAVSSHACMQGSYTHRYETTGGPAGRDVWLCCVPVEEILSDSFRCADSPFPAVFGTSDDAKVRFCSLQHPTSPEPRFIPVCVPAPLRAPDLDG